MKQILLLVLLGISTCLSAQIDLSENLLFYYQLENNATDASTKQNNGLANNLTYTTGKFNNGGEFNGVDCYIQSPPAMINPATTDLTVAAWVYVRSFLDKSASTIGLEKQKMVCQMQDGTGKGRSFLYLNPTGNLLQSFLGGSTITGSDSVVENQWAHVALVVTSAESRATLYYNGKVIADSVTKNPIEACDGEFNFGCHKISGGVLSYPDRLFDGYMDEIALLNKALTSTEINSLLTHGAIQGTGTKDLSGKANPVKIVSVSGGVLNIRLTEDFNLNKANLTIYDLAGKKVLSKEINSVYSNINTGLKSGNYLISIESDKSKYRSSISIR